MQVDLAPKTLCCLRQTARCPHSLALHKQASHLRCPIVYFSFDHKAGFSTISEDSKLAFGPQSKLQYVAHKMSVFDAVMHLPFSICHLNE